MSAVKLLELMRMGKNPTMYVHNVPMEYLSRLLADGVLTELRPGPPLEHDQRLYLVGHGEVEGVRVSLFTEHFDEEQS